MFKLLLVKQVDGVARYINASQIVHVIVDADRVLLQMSDKSSIDLIGKASEAFLELIRREALLPNGLPERVLPDAQCEICSEPPAEIVALEDVTLPMQV